MPTEPQQNWNGPDRRQIPTEQALLVRLVDKMEQLSAKVDATHLSLIRW